ASLGYTPGNFQGAFDKSSRLLLKREGDVCKLSVDGNKVVTHQIAETDCYKRIRIELNSPQSKIDYLGVKFPEGAKEKPAGWGQRPRTSALLHHQDFGEASEGPPPKGWTGESAFEVARNGSSGWLQLSKEDMKYELKSPSLEIRGDFQLDCRYILPNF